MQQTGTWHYIEDSERRKWQNPEQILCQIGLSSGHTFLDVGCGNGFFAIPAARLVGPTGRVYGLDAQGSAIEELKQKAAAEGLNNLKLITDKAEENAVCGSCADFVFFGIVLHDFDDPAQVLERAHGMLKPQGKLIDLDWKKIRMKLGPPFAKRFDEAKASAMIEKAGFTIESVQDSGQYHYIITARLRNP